MSARARLAFVAASAARRGKTPPRPADVRRTGRAATTSRALAAAILLAVAAARAPAQDFASPAPPALSAAAAAPAHFLEHGLPGPRASIAAQALESRWYEVPGLVTRAVAVAAGWRSIRAAAGISRTGDPELGWSTCAIALGVAGGRAGGGLRAVARRDLDPRALDAALGPGTGLEVGGGAWADAGAGVSLFASAPQIFMRGEAPPLERGFELGACWVMDDLSLRLARVSGRGGAAVAQHEAGLALAAGPVTAWLEARDQPARGALGLAARLGTLEVAAVVESHPLLGETVRLSLLLSPGP